MSQAFLLKRDISDKLKKDICAICGNIISHGYSVSSDIYVKLCDTCYGNIPNHIPLDQDSQYIESLLRKKL